MIQDPGTEPAVGFDPFAEGAPTGTGPTTEAQREILTVCRMGADGTLCYNEGIHLSFRGPLDARALVGGLAALFRRHEALRSSFSTDNDAFFVWDRELEVRRVRADAGEADGVLQGILHDAVREPFDVDRGPLFRATLLEVGPERWELILAAHHLVCDGWSFGVLVGELADHYRAAVEGRAAPQAAAPAYSAFAAREGGAVEADDHEFWKRIFEGAVPTLELPAARLRPSVLGFTADRVTARLDRETVAALRAAAGAVGGSLFTVLLAGFYAFLHRLTGQSHLVVAIPTAGQPAAGMPGLVGHCVNVLPMPAAVDAGEPFAGLARRVGARLQDAFEHPGFTLGRLMRTVSVPRDPSRRPAASVMFNLDRALRRELAGFVDLDVSVRSVPRVAEYFELFLNLVEEQDGITVECQYNAELFDADTASAWVEAYLELLRSAARDTGARVAELEWIPEGVRDDLFRGWQGPPVSLPTGSVVRLVQAAAAVRPDAPALRWSGGTLGYAELLARAGAVAAALRARGVVEGDLVGLCVPRGPELPVALLGILAAGAAYVPLDPEHPPARVRLVLADAAPATIVCRASQLPRLAELLGEEGPTLVPLEELLREGASAMAPPAADDAANRADDHVDDHAGERIAYVIYTSGSTGTPKGVRVPHRAVVNVLVSLATRLGIGPDDAIPAVTTPTFDISVLELLLPLAVGGTTVFLEDPAQPDPAALSDELARLGVTTMQATPSAWAVLIEGGWPGHPGLRVLCGGETLPARLAGLLLDRTRELWNMYGPTETTVWSACHRVTRGDDPVPLGRPIGNTRTHVLDQRGRPLPPGIPGEIAIGGAGLAEGYHRRADLTAERFVVSSDGAELLYRTGDVGRWRPDGRLVFHGRNDDQIKLRGHRIELAEVESAFASHPAVRSVAAALRPGPGGEPSLVAYLVAAGAEVPGDEALRAHARARLPEYMVPHRCAWVARIPRSAAGKVDRRALPDLPSLEHARDEPEQALLSDEARAAAAIWEELLGVPVTSGAHDFFELGGHSVIAARVIARVNARFGIALGLRALFEASRFDAFVARTTAARADLADGWEEIFV